MMGALTDRSGLCITAYAVEGIVESFLTLMKNDSMQMYEKGEEVNA